MATSRRNSEALWSVVDCGKSMGVSQVDLEPHHPSLSYLEGIVWRWIVASLYHIHLTVIAAAKEWRVLAFLLIIVQ